MRNVLCCALLVPVLALAAGNLRSETVVAPPIRPAVQSQVRDGGTPPSLKTTSVGTVDTIGGSIYDWVVNGPTYRFCVNAPGYGLHTLWMYSNDTIGTQADRNMRYNFYDFASRTWNWIDPDFMVSGVNVFTERAGFGSIAADPATGAAVASAHVGNIRPIVARDIAAGAGIFEYCDGSPVLDGYLWPPVDVTQDRTIQMHCIDDASRDNMWYTRAAAWCNWDPPVSVNSVAATFPTQQVAASKNSNKVCLTWVKADAFPYVGYYRLSEDGGTNWGPETEFPNPPAFTPGSETLSTYYITSLNPFYDANDMLHIIVDVSAIIGDTVWGTPNEIWDWCADRTPEWSLVHHTGMDRYGSQATGTNAMFACRPQLGRDNDGNLFAVWEQFDTLNVEPVTNLMRADVWLSGSNDNGITWTPGMMINTQSSTSKRFPSISDIAIDGGSDYDTVAVFYIEDSIAGPKAGSSPVGIWSFNPMIMHKIPVDIIGIAEQRPGAMPTRLELSANPNPFGARTRISYALPKAGDVSLVVYDASGRAVKTLASGRVDAGRYTATWDAGSVSAGVYFYTLTSGESSVTKKLTLTH